jgi:nucleotide-binding universal stress UspA family protein
MSTSALSPTAHRLTGQGRRTARTLVVVADPAGPQPAHERVVPDWVARWCRHAQWELQPHPGTGPGAAAAAAQHDVRVLVLRPDIRPTGRGDPTSPRPASPRIVAAVRNLPDDAPVVADAAACAALRGGRLTIVHAVPRSFAERSVGLDGAVAHGRRLLDAAARLSCVPADLPVDCALLRMRPYELVGGALDADLLVVGGPRGPRHGDARPAGGGPGLVAHSALHHAPCPVLLTPR